MELDLARAVDVLLENADLVLSIREVDNVMRSRIHSHFRACGVPTFSIVDRSWNVGDGEIGRLKGVEHTCITCDTVKFTATKDFRPHSWLTDDPYDDDYMQIFCSRPGCPGCMGYDDDGLIDLYYLDDCEQESRTFRRVFDNNTVLAGQIFSRYPVERHNRHKQTVKHPELVLNTTKWFVAPESASPLHYAADLPGVLSRSEWEQVMPSLRTFPLLDTRAWMVVLANIRHNNRHRVSSWNGRLAVPMRPLGLIAAML